MSKSIDKYLQSLKCGPMYESKDFHQLIQRFVSQITQENEDHIDQVIKDVTDDHSEILESIIKPKMADDH